MAELDALRLEMEAEYEVMREAKRRGEIEGSIAGRLGAAFEPLIAPLGFDWKIGTALIGAFAAKEVFVSQMGIVYSLGEVDGESTGLQAALRDRPEDVPELAVWLASSGLALSPGHWFGREGAGCGRMTIAVPEDTIRTAVGLLNDATARRSYDPTA